MSRKARSGSEKPSQRSRSARTRDTDRVHADARRRPGAWTHTRAQGPGPCAPPNSNPIVCENQLSGNPDSEWDVHGAGDATIQGFATDISVDQGQTISFKIDTDATPYRLDIYRMGYYGGMGARKVATVNPSAHAAAEPAELPDRRARPAWSTAATGRCRRRGPCRRPPSPASTSPRSMRTDTGGASHIVFVVRDDDGSSDLLFQTSDTTWQAYNQYGGNSLYVGGPGPAGRAYKVSYNRPFTTRGDVARRLGLQRRVPDGALAGGQRLRRQLLHRRRHRPPRRRAARAQGVPVGRPRRVLVRRPAHQRRGRPRRRRPPRVLQRQRGVLEDALGEQHRRLGHAVPHAGQLQGDARQRQDRSRRRRLDRHLARPALQSAGRRRPARERADRHDLHGQLPAPTRHHGARGRRQDALLAQHDVASLAPGRSATLPDGTLGYEWDEDRDNGFRPAGLDPPVRHHRQRRRVPAGLRLDVRAGHREPRADALPAPERRAGVRRRHGPVVLGPRQQPRSRRRRRRAARMQQATVNLFADMGVQPVTLQPGLVAADRVDRHAARRRRRSSSPANGASVPANTTDHDHRHRDRPAAASSAASRSRSTAARPGAAPPAATLDLRLADRRAATVTISQPRRRRQRQPRGADRRRHRDRRHGRRVRAPARSGRRPDARARSPRAIRARRARHASSAPTSNGYITGDPLLQEQRRTPARTSATSGHHRSPAGARSPSPARRRRAGSRRRCHSRSRSPRTRPTSCRTTRPRASTPATTATSRATASTTGRCMRSPDGAIGAERRLPLRRAAASRTRRSTARTTGSTSCSSLDRARHDAADRPDASTPVERRLRRRRDHDGHGDLQRERDASTVNAPRSSCATARNALVPATVT